MSPSEQVQYEINLIFKEISRENLRMKVIPMNTIKNCSEQIYDKLKYSCYNFNN